jgi:hypothetical protein
MIRTYIDNSKLLTTHTLIGKITVEDLLAEIKKFFDTEPTPHNLWDLLDADVSAIGRDDIGKLSRFPLEYVPSRVGGKTAIVAADDLSFGLSRMYQTCAEIEGQKVQIQVFRSLENAQAWLDG